MRLARVRYSLAEKTPLRFSPSIPMNFGSPAPVPTKTASNPSFATRSLSLRVRPTTKFVSIFTPRSLSPSISWRTIAFGRRNSGIP